MSDFFTLDPQKVEIGDVLLSAEPDAKMSKLIRMATRGPYSHAAMCVSPGVFVEAQMNGVKRYHARRVQIDDPATIRLLRLKPEVDPSGSIRRKAAYEAESLLTHAYNFRGVAAALAPSTREGANENADRVFCSQLVARAFLAAGVPLTALPPAKTVPNAFLGCDLLADVSDYAIVIGIDRIFDDADGGEDLRDREIRMHRYVLDDASVRARLHRLHRVAPPSFYALTAVLVETRDSMLDRAVARALKAVEFEGTPDILAATVLLVPMDARLVTARARTERWDRDRIVRELYDQRGALRSLRETLAVNERDTDGYDRVLRVWPTSPTFAILATTYRRHMALTARTIASLETAIEALERLLRDENTEPNEP